MRSNIRPLTIRISFALTGEEVIDQQFSGNVSFLFFGFNKLLHYSESVEDRVPEV